MYKKIFLVIHVWILLECTVILPSQLTQQEQIAFVAAENSVAYKKYADFLAATPDLNNQILVDKVGKDLI